MAKPSFDQFADMLDRAVDRIPSRFLRDLTGGFNLRQDTKREGEYYILGEYIEDGIGGCFIMFYYGSFAGVLEDGPEDCWETEIVETVLHELQHHLESLAGCDDLARKEIEELARFLQGV
ncbi:MAG: metallopeptidase family protein [Desulfotomaculaceae bacterium]|nr:metallopeptidase family protein [Desulfotomaculaceae bacterium]MDD4766134.1 metallopeptidase family protein [Desulfotomaculaceae bacterium]